MGEPVRRGERLGRTIRGTKGHYLSTRVSVLYSVTHLYVFLAIIFRPSVMPPTTRVAASHSCPGAVLKT